MNDELAEIEPLGRLLFAGLWTIADREGRLEDRPKKIKAEVLPYDECDIDKLLTSLNGKFILRYEVDGNKYIQILNFNKHQNPHKNENSSIIPPPPEKIESSTVQVPEHSQTNPADSLSLDSFNLIPDTTTENPIPEKEPTAAEVVKKFEKVFGRLFNPIEIQKLNYWQGKYLGSVILHALEIAVLNNKYKFSYIDGILLDWENNNLKTLPEIMEYEEQYKSRNNKGHPRNRRDEALKLLEDDEDDQARNKSPVEANLHSVS